MKLLPAFVKLCAPRSAGARRIDGANWSIGREDASTPLDLNRSLLDAYIVNGTVLLLREQTAWGSPQHIEYSSTHRLGHLSHGHATTFHVPVREYPPRLSTEEIVIGAPPQVALAQSGVASWLQMLLPVIGCLGGAVFFLSYFLNGSASGGHWMLIIAIVVPLITIVASVSTILIQRWTAKRQRKYAREKYLEYLNAWRTRLRETADLQKLVNSRLYPDLPVLTKNVIDRQYLWERRPTDYDFLHISVGRGPVPLNNRIHLGLGADPMVKYEPELRADAEALVAQYHHIDDEPAIIPLRTTGVLAITGKRTSVLPLVRAMLCQIVAFHTPRDVRCAAYFPRAATPEWSWLKWLPHVQLLRHSKALHQQTGEALCLLADNPTACQELLTTQIKPELELRRKLNEDKRADGAKVMLPHLIIIIDGYIPGSELAQMPEVDELFRDAAMLGVTILCIVDEAGWEPTGTQSRIVVTEGGWLSFEVASFEGRRMKGVVPNATNVETSETIARSLALITLADGGMEDDFSQDIRLLDLLDVPIVESIQPSKMWVQRPRESVLRAPIGKLEKGKTLLLDLKEAAEKGDGPHGLVVGATGSGKSELLRTLVISQAMIHDPSIVNFVFVDFKGGASFADLASLPHVAGMVTNLENEPSLVDRMYSSLMGELRRRQRMLREAGNLDNVQQYQIKWKTNSDSMEPMPHLLLIVDEFAELLTNRPDFLDLFITIGRVGRSLGLHLLLATQRLEEGRLKGLESYLRYRICLRTFSAAESSAVLGKPDAYYLPSSPGVGYLKIDASTPLRFKTALVSVPYIPTTRQLIAADSIREFTPSGRLVPNSTIITDISAIQADANMTEMDVIIARLAEPVSSENQVSVHQVWLPPLPKSLKLEALLNKHFDASSWYADPQFGPLRVPVGLLDIPLEQVQVPLLLDFSGAGGHLALAGAPQSGKSTFLRTLMTSFIVTHTPRDVQLYCIDLGGGQLRPFAAFPHVGAVCTKTDREKILLLMRLMYKVIADREVLFRDHNIESMATFRMRRQAGDFSNFPFGDVFLIIDNIAQLLHDFEQIEADLVNLVATGLTYGVHIIVASNRWAEVRAKIRDNIGTRLELRLNDPADSEVDKKKSAELPIGIPGRGLTKEKLQFQICLPWISTDLPSKVAGELSQQQALDTLIERTGTWRGPVASPVLMLPSLVKRQQILQAEVTRRAGVPIGLEEFRLDPIYIDLLSAEPHFLVLGDAECGKTNLLRLWYSELTRRYTPDQLKIAVIECRATTNLLDITQSKHFLTYASMRMPSSVKESVECLTNTLKERALPTTYSSIQDLASTNAWTGPHYFLFVDDYDAIASPSGSPLVPLRDLIVQARDVGFHVILTRTISGLASSSYETIIKSLRESGSPGLIMSGNRQEGKLLHDQAATNLPVGRGYLVQRKYPATQVQVALA